MRLLKMVVAVALMFVAAMAAHRLAWERYRCNVERANIGGAVREAARRSEYEKRTIANRVIPRLVHCVKAFPADYEMRFLLAGAYRLSGQREMALETYHATLALNERPEIHAQIAQMNLEEGDVAAGLDRLTRAVSFNVGYVLAVDATTAEEIMKRVEARRERLRAAKGSAQQTP